MRPAALVQCSLALGLLGSVWTTGIDDIVRANGDFAFKLYGQLKSASKNLFYSPMSVSSALAMTYAGARGNTKTEMERALSFGPLGSDNAVHAAFKSLLVALEEPTNNYTLNIANRIFGRQDFDISSDFTNTVQSNYDASMGLLDFEQDPEGSREDINNWVEEQTNDKIKNLLPQGTVTRSTVMVLVNAIYFKGLWKLPFDPLRTTRRPFHTSDTESVQMDMMSLEKKYFNYLEHSEWDCSILELPYEGNKASMVILLPNTKTGIGRIEDNISIDGLTSAMNDMRSEEVLVTIPKFKLTQMMSLKAFLNSLGMEDLFDSEEADLSGISDEHDLYVTEVVHKAYVDVNEEGTEAAGATGVIIGVTAIQPPPKVFLADKTFMFLLRDTTTGSIFFVGKLAEPPVEEASVGAFGRLRSQDTQDGNGSSVLASCIYLLLITVLSYVISH